MNRRRFLRPVCSDALLDWLFWPGPDTARCGICFDELPFSEAYVVVDFMGPPAFKDWRLTIAFCPHCASPYEGDITRLEARARATLYPWLHRS